MEMVVVPRPLAHPGRDLHGHQDGPTIDTLVEIPGYGRVYLSVNAIKVASRLLGFAPPERWERLERVAVAQRERISELESHVAEMTPAYMAVKGLANPVPEPPPANLSLVEDEPKVDKRTKAYKDSLVDLDPAA